MKKTILSFVLILIMISQTLGVSFAVKASTGEMTSILSEFSEFQVGNTLNYAGDSYVSTGAEIAVFFDSENHSAVPGFGGTPVILYVVGSMAQRTGTKSDCEIIASMLERGYIVAVADFKGSQEAAVPDLDWSVQNLRASLKSGTYFTDTKIIPSGTYPENFVVPAGHDVSLNNVFWEIDKHSTEGTLEKIVEIWNNDFRGTRAETIIKWTDSEGNRKPVQNGHDSSTPVWLDSNGNADPNGEYIKVKHTLAETITDCVKKDGSPIDLNLYMHIIYPTSPESSVPVMTLASSTEHLASAAATADRPQLNGFTFSGYAGVIYDYGYTPMARSDHYSYFDGNASAGHVSGDNLVYSIYVYNDKLIDTAAMRYIRYLSLEENEKYKFDRNSIGVYGNSKGGYITHLGEKNPEENPNWRYFPGHHGETRYENGNISASGIIDGGEIQPWLDYEGDSIDSGADFVYASCGGMQQYITEGHAPTYVSHQLTDASAYSTSASFTNLLRIYNVPSLSLEVAKGHTFASGYDVNYGVDSYKALIDFAGYWLKNDAVKVVYSSPVNNAENVSPKEPVRIKFTGRVDAEEIKKVSIKSGESIAKGNWSSSYGGTEWTFTPSQAYLGNSTYKICVPADLAGDNGKVIGAEYAKSFKTELGNLFSDISGVSDKVDFDENAVYVTTTVPSVETFDSYNADILKLRFNVKNNAANTAVVYPVTNYSQTNPAESTLGEAIGEVKVNGEGIYELDITDYISLYAPGECVTFKIVSKNPEGTKEIYAPSSGHQMGACNFDYSTSSVSTATIGGHTVLRIGDFKTKTNYATEEFYANPFTMFTNNETVGKLKADDYGRRFAYSFDVYDTVSRMMPVFIGSLSSQTNSVIDYQQPIFNFKTKADSWSTVSFDYNVYDNDYDVISEHSRQLAVQGMNRGNMDTPVYFKNLRVNEVFTNLDITTAELCLETSADDFESPYSNIPEEYADTNEYPFVIFLADGSFYRAFTSYKLAMDSMMYRPTGAVLYLRRDYDLPATNYPNLIQHGERKHTIDLGGHTLTTGSAPLLHFYGKSTWSQINFTVKNGTLKRGDAAPVSFGNQSTTLSRVFNLDFENVTFALKDNTKTSLIFSYSGFESEAKVNVNFNDCVFDLSSVVAQGDISIFDISEENKLIDMDITVNGGSIKAEDFGGVRICNVTNDKSSVLFVSEDGEYTTLNLSNNAQTLPKEIILTKDGECTYSPYQVTASRTVYKLKEPDPTDTITQYGVIPAQYFKKSDYPFVLFKSGGGNGIGFSSWSSAWSAMRYSASGGGNNSVLLLRRDYDATSSELGYTNVMYHNNHTIDLGGYTINTPGALFNVMNKGTSDTSPTVIDIKNGQINIGASGFAVFAQSSPQIERTITFNCEGVTFGLCEGATASSLITYQTLSKNIYAYVNYTDCNFDLETVSPASAFTLFDAGDSNGYARATITVTGGVSYAESLSGIKIAASGNDSSKVVFKADNNGGYMKLIMEASSSAPDEVLATDGGKCIYSAESTSNGKTTYILQSNATSVETAYGVIPVSYSDADLYPFVAFNSAGSVKGFESWYSAWSALRYTGTGGGNNSVLLLRRDYEMTQSDKNYTNLLYHNNHTIDLDGNTISSDGAIFAAMNKGSSDTSPTVLSIKNGVFELGGNMGFVNFAQISPQVERNVTFNMENVEFKLSENASMASFITASNLSKSIYANYNLTDCTFNTGAYAPDAGFVLFDAGDDNGYLKEKVNISGGKMLAQTTDDISLYDVNNASSAVVFGANKNNEYMILSLPESEPAPWLFANTDKGLWAYNILLESSGDVSEWKIGFDTKLGFTNDGVALSNSSNSDCVLVVASYLGNILLDVAFVDVSADTTVYANTFENLGVNTDGATKVKIMLIDSTENIKPLCSGEEK